jgi:serine/threonine protein kinase
MLSALKKGYLTKEGEIVKSWKRRWFVLSSETLSYYKTQKEDKPLGVIRLKDINSVTAGSRKNKSCLEVATARRTYYFVADNNEELKAWKEAIQRRVDISLGRAVEDSVTQKAQQEALKKVSIDDFDLLTVIGQGSFGKVVTARHKASGNIYAMKILDKKNIVDRGEINHTMSERNILQRIRHPFIMTLHFAFQTADKLYLVMDFVNGGELFYHLQNARKFTTERARFYAAEIVLGLEHLHKNGIVYRDLKPENLLLDADGHICMTDFGLSKEGLFTAGDRTNTFCGTPEYLAPEVLLGEDYNKSVDWWSLGTLIFEMLTGLPPFYDEDVQKMYNLKMTAELKIPDYVDPSAADLIRKLLQRDPAKRLQDPAEIKQHPFFKGIDWEKLYNKQIVPPYKPPVKSKESVECIDSNFTEMGLNDLDKKTQTNSNVENQEYFQNFTYDPSKDYMRSQMNQANASRTKQQLATGGVSSKTVTFVTATPSPNTSKAQSPQAGGTTPVSAYTSPSSPSTSTTTTSTVTTTATVSSPSPSSQTNGAPSSNEYVFKNVHYTGQPYTFAK